ncbi:hypothetical protein HELRODRAFT_174326 [Helobdella robusta]|uniref:Endonuclease/exonuclease/phosphatase domain-containing protein n=1 Tax=Helobdella robusta TaxID=6412 RepID=T1F805_HELRO|nr:hypothetical protein HELRODRAFT_174326 [Helobdella robusta]ESO02884.1 hypothetical protein HELRODRAFT_174326 [Helobdella robusta]
MAQMSFADTTNKLETFNDREKRKSNIIIYNLQESGSHKIAVNNLIKEITGSDMDSEVIEVFRMGRKSDENKTRPILVQDGHSANILDLVISNQEFVKNVMIYPPLGKSDHSVVCFKQNLHISMYEEGICQLLSVLDDHHLISDK